MPMQTEDFPEIGHTGGWTQDRISWPAAYEVSAAGLKPVAHTEKKANRCWKAFFIL